jgi:hypothetical protein
MLPANRDDRVVHVHRTLDVAFDADIGGDSGRGSRPRLAAKCAQNEKRLV